MDPTLIKVFYGFGVSIVVTILIYLFAKWLEPKSTEAPGKAEQYVGGEKPFVEKVSVFIKNYDYVILFTLVEVAVIIISFVFWSIKLVEILLYIFIVLLIIFVAIAYKKEELEEEEQELQ